MLKLYWKNYLYRLTVILPVVLLLIVSVLTVTSIFRKDIEYSSDQMRLYSSSSFENGYVLNYRSGLANEFAFPEFDISLYVNNDMQERLPLSCVMELNETDYTDASLVRRQYSTHLNENEIEISERIADLYSLNIGDVVVAEYPHSATTKELTIVSLLSINYDVVNPNAENNIGVGLLGYCEDYILTIDSKYVVFSNESLAEELSGFSQIINKVFSISTHRSLAIRQLISFFVFLAFILLVNFILQIMIITRRSSISIAVLHRKGLNTRSCVLLILSEILMLFVIPSCISFVLSMYFIEATSTFAFQMLVVFVSVVLIISAIYLKSFLYLIGRR